MTFVTDPVTLCTFPLPRFCGIIISVNKTTSERLGDLMKYKWQIIGGVMTTSIMWDLLCITDAFDEYVLDQSSLVGSLVFFLAPIALFVIYLLHFFKKRPAAAPLLVWHTSYTLSFIPVWIYMWCAVNSRHFFIKQFVRSSFLDLNGIEYMFYGATALCLFLILCLLFHIGRAIAAAVKKNMNN